MLAIITPNFKGDIMNKIKTRDFLASSAGAVIGWSIASSFTESEPLKIAGAALGGAMLGGISLATRKIFQARTVDDLEIQKGKISIGQGEYVAFYPENIEKKLDPDTFEQIYAILNEYAPAAIVNRNSESAEEECANRYDLIQSKIKEIDEDLEVAFVPRTLYELVFLRQCIEEDIANNSVCPFIGGSWSIGEQYLPPDNIKAEKTKRKCWHLCCFADEGHNDDHQVKEVAYRLNQVIIEALSPKSGGFTYQDLMCHAEKEISFLKEHHQKFCNIKKEYERHGRTGVPFYPEVSQPGPTMNFATEYQAGRLAPMGIRNDNDAQILRNAIALECSKIAEKAFLLYRGSELRSDVVFDQSQGNFLYNSQNVPYSLSYGSGLFAGAIHDGEAVAFHYMRNGKNAYAMAVPFDQLNQSPFFIPCTNSLVQLFGTGESFHGRTKVWKGSDTSKKPAGINLRLRGESYDHLLSSLSKKDLIAQFQKYKNQAILLK